jgi:CRP-like cAMP-binding protein
MHTELSQALEHVAISALLRKGEVLFRCGDPIGAVYLIRTGRLSLECPTAGQTIQVESTEPGQIVGVSAALTGSCQLTARTLDDCNLGYIPLARFADLLDSRRSLWMSIARLVSEETLRIRLLIRREPRQ